MNDAIMQISNYLRLKKPFKVVLKSGKCKKADAKYWPMNKKKKLHSHLIHIYLGNNSARNTAELIAHELCHAKQAEKKKKDIHGKSFRKYAKKVSEKFDLRDIYIKQVDE